MAKRRTIRARETQLTFEALSIEGGLIAADWLARIAQLGASGQSEADYRIPKGLNLRDEIGRYWRMAQARWADFARGTSAGGDARALAEAFVLGLLRESFGFASLEKVAPVSLGDRTFPIGHAALAGRVPVVIAPAGSGVDGALAAFGDGSRKRSAFGVAQEFLNANDDALWGFATDGKVLRIVRDNASLTRPAWIEADLARVFTEERYADFAALWLLCHESRFGAPGTPATDAALETWRNAGREEGTRARDQLRRGVEDALVALGGGFLAHPENVALRSALETGTLTKEALFQELLRLVYRIIFLLTAEERDVLHAPGAADAAKKLYAEGYGLRRLRDRAARRSAHDRFGDVWQALKIVLRGLARGEARLGLPALGGLFDDDQCPSLDAAKLENRALLQAVFRLSWIRDEGSLARVNWRDMGPEELGSVYESLLELVPQVTEDRRRFGFATGAETKGNARKTTGSYYTPESLVQVLLDSALEPVVADTLARNPEKPVEALLSLSIVDPACGSGHFLLSAARRLAAHVARLEASGTPSADQYRHALRRVVGRCIFGVDLNPMAVELCKVSLWMEAVEPGRPLSFLDSHIQHGNALLGATPELMAKGIPDSAWEPIEGDDKKIASALKKQNKEDAKAAADLPFEPPPASTYMRLSAGARAVDDAVDESLDAVEAKEQTWRDLLASGAYEHQRFLADLWCAAFVWRKEPGEPRDLAPTDGVFRAVQRDGTRASLALREEVARLREQYRFFHWHLAFPQVKANGGFDVVLGNPPWDKVELLEREWFAAKRPDIAASETAALRKRRIDALKVDAPDVYAQYTHAIRLVDAQRHFFRNSARCPLCSGGRTNLYALFAEVNRSLIREGGRIGCILPSGIATDDTTRLFFGELLRSGSLVSLYDFENRQGLFPDVQGNVKFCLFTATTGGVAAFDMAAQLDGVDSLKDPTRRYKLSLSDVASINPNTLNAPMFVSVRAAEIARRVHSSLGVFCREVSPPSNPWRVELRQGLFNMTSDSGLFQTLSDLTGAELRGNQLVKQGVTYLPLCEAKLVFQYDHRAATFGGTDESARFRTHAGTNEVTDSQRADPNFVTIPRFWVEEGEVSRAAGEVKWLLVFRDIISAVADSRSLIASIIPRCGVGNTLPIVSTGVGRDGAEGAAALVAYLNSFVADFMLRQKASGSHLNFYIFKQLPVPSPDVLRGGAAWCSDERVQGWIVRRVLELVFTAWDLASFADDLGMSVPPFRWEPARRFLLRCELDAAFCHICGLSRDDTEYVMDTFPIVRKNDEKAHGEYRTKRVILEIYDAITEAIRTGRPYATRLDPPPADPRVAHPPRTDAESGRRSA